jgi:hypothetical protein
MGSMGAGLTGEGAYIKVDVRVGGSVNTGTSSRYMGGIHTFNQHTN